jgi:hypothetical protein
MAIESVVVWRKVKDTVATAALWLLVGWGCASYYYRALAPPLVVPPVPAVQPAPAPLPPAPAPPPAPATPVHAGHFTVSYVEPKYPSPASAAVREGLAKVKASGIDTTYRSYTEGQTQLTTLGFTAYFKSADLPMVFLQEDQVGGAPIIGSLKSPASAEAVVRWVQGFRGQ